MGIKSCTNCNNICSEKGKKIETNLSNLQINNEIDQNYFLFGISSFNKTYSQNYHENKRLNEIMILNKVRKIINAYKQHLNKHKIVIREKINSNNLSLNFKKYSNDTINQRNYQRELFQNNTEIIPKSSKSLFNFENNFNSNEYILSTSENEYISNKITEKTTDYSKMNIPKILLQKKYKKKKSCLKLNHKEDIGNSKRKNVSFMNPIESNILKINDSKKNQNYCNMFLLNNNKNN